MKYDGFTLCHPEIGDRYQEYLREYDNLDIGDSHRFDVCRNGSRIIVMAVVAHWESSTCTDHQILILLPRGWWRHPAPGWYPNKIMGCLPSINWGSGWIRGFRWPIHKLFCHQLGCRTRTIPGWAKPHGTPLAIANERGDVEWEVIGKWMYHPQKSWNDMEHWWRMDIFLYL